MCVVALHLVLLDIFDQLNSESLRGESGPEFGACDQGRTREELFHVVELSSGSLRLVGYGAHDCTNTARSDHSPEPEHIVNVSIEIRDGDLARLDNARLTQGSTISLLTMSMAVL